MYQIYSVYAICTFASMGTLTRMPLSIGELLRLDEPS